jgi:hypothetical protein
MGCPETATLGQNLTFTIQASDTSGSPVDTDALPTYSAYEDETGTAIATGTMAKLDDAGTTGFYSEELAITSANGYELHKSYAVRVSAAIGGTAVSRVFSFRVITTALSVSATSGALTTTANFKTYAGITGTDDDSLIASLITRATSAIERYCDRTLVSTTHREFYDGSGDYELYTNEYPITAISLLSAGRTDVIKVNNSSSDAWNATVLVDSTNCTLTIYGGTNDGSDSLTLASYTITTLVAAIVALGKGWSASVQLSDYASWEADQLIPATELRCLDSDYAYLETPDEPEYDYRFEADTGRIYLPTGFPAGTQNITLRYTAGYATTPADLEQITIDLVNVYYRARELDTSVKSEKLGDHSITYLDEGGGGARDIPSHIAKRLAPYKKVRCPVC